MRLVIVFLAIVLCASACKTQTPVPQTPDVSYELSESEEKRSAEGLVKAQQTQEGIEVYLTDRVAKNLSLTYLNLTSEIPFCLFGTHGPDRIVVERAEFPTISTSTDSTTTYEDNRCTVQSDFLGFVHNHDPYKSLCQPSPIDMKRFALDSDSEIEVIACPYLTKTDFFAIVKPNWTE
jgi:hypothetical protein